MAFDFNKLLWGLDQKVRRAMPTATRRAFLPALTPGTIFSSAKPPVTVPGAILGLSGKITERIALPVAIYEQGRQVFNPQDNIITRLGQLGTGIENLSQGKPYLTGRTQAQKKPDSRPVGTQAVLNGKPVYWGGDNYGWQQLNQMGTSATLNALNSPGALATFTGAGPAQERAYQTEKARVAQLTAQDPELQRYEKARAAAKTQEEMNAARDIGMQIWQQKYGKTPMAQPGGAIGVDNPVMLRTFGYQTGSAPDQQIGEPTLGPSPLVPQIDQSLNPASPNYIGGEGAPLMDFTREDVSPEVIAAYQKQLLEQAAAGRK